MIWFVMSLLVSVHVQYSKQTSYKETSATPSHLWNGPPHIPIYGKRHPLILTFTEKDTPSYSHLRKKTPPHIPIYGKKTPPSHSQLWKETQARAPIPNTFNLQKKINFDKILDLKIFFFFFFLYIHAQDKRELRRDPPVIDMSLPLVSYNKAVSCSNWEQKFKSGYHSMYWKTRKTCTGCSLRFLQKSRVGNSLLRS